MSFPIPHDYAAEADVPEPAPLDEAAEVPTIPTGFPTPPSPEELPPPRTPGMIMLYAVPPMGTLTVPSLDGKGEPVVIDRYGVEVDEATAQRAREAAQTSGFLIREE